MDRAVREGKKTALIGLLDVGALFADRLEQLGLALPDRIEFVGGWFFVVENPTLDVLNACLFMFHPEPPRSDES